jgi:hypothetical protein
MPVHRLWQAVSHAYENAIRLGSDRREDRLPRLCLRRDKALVNVTRQNDILPALPATERDIATKLNVTLSTARAYLYRLKVRGLAVKTMRNPAWWERVRC